MSTSPALSLASRAAPLAPAAHQPPVIDAGALLARGIEHGLSVDALERLLSMRRELQAEEARSAFFSALARFQSEIPPIHKGQTARVQSAKGSFSYTYADLGDIQRAIAPTLAACGLSVTFDTEQESGGYVVIAKVHHLAGHSERTVFRVPVDNQARMNSTQAAGAALTYGRRYALTAALGIVTADEDDDAQSAWGPTRTAAPSPQTAPPGAPQPMRQSEAPIPTITPAQHALLEARIHAHGLDRERVKAWLARAWGIAHLDQIPAARFDDLLARLEQWAGREYAAQQASAALEETRSQSNDEWLADFAAARHGA